jgi:carbonic anhydrase
MSTIDYVYRFDPSHPTTKPHPADAEAARRALEEGNRTFSRWMRSCQQGQSPPGEAPYLVACNANEVGRLRKPGEAPAQSPFAIILGCSDARAPAEMIFGQGFNNLFSIRVAGNVLGDLCAGSIDFAVGHLSDSLKVLLVLGHTGCGAVTGAVDTYLRPTRLWARTVTPALRVILEKIFVAVRAAANAFREVYGGDVRQAPGYREALVEAAVCVNAAQAAFDLRHSVESAGKWDIEVLHAVYSLHTHRVSMPVDPSLGPDEQEVRLAPAPTTPKEFHGLAVRMALLTRPILEGKPPQPRQAPPGDETQEIKLPGP